MSKDDEVDSIRHKAEAGDLSSQKKLAHWFVHGHASIERSDVEAVKFYSLAAEHPNEDEFRFSDKEIEVFNRLIDRCGAQLQRCIGDSYGRGRWTDRTSNVEQSDNEAVRWYKLAAGKGDAIAQHKLALAYHNGPGIQQSVEEAVKWYERAAEQGYCEAQYDLALMYYNGQECAALWGLACHAKQLEFSSVRDAVLLPCGWVKVLDDGVVKQMQVVAEKLNRAGFTLIESRDQTYFRLSATPNIIFLDESQFRYSYGAADAAKSKDCWFRLCLEPKDTPLGCVTGIDRKFTIPRSTMRIIESIENDDDPEALCSDVQKTIRDQIDAHTKPLGLRKFVRFRGRRYEILLIRLA